MSAEEQLIATVLDATYAALSSPISTGKCKACGEIISPFVDECADCSREPIYCPDCGKQHSGFRAFGAYMMDGKTPCDGYDCTRCGNRWHIIRDGECSCSSP